MKNTKCHFLRRTWNGEEPTGWTRFTKKIGLTLSIGTNFGTKVLISKEGQVSCNINYSECKNYIILIFQLLSLTLERGI